MDENFLARSFDIRPSSSDEDICIVKEVPPVPTTERPFLSHKSSKRKEESDSSDSDSYRIFYKMFKRFVRRERILRMSRLSSSETKEKCDRPRRSPDRRSERPSSSDRRCKRRKRNTSSDSESHSNMMRTPPKKTFKKRMSSSDRLSSGNEEEFDAQLSQYPLVPAGVHRQVVNDESWIQHSVETNFPPCPGLEHVVEIRGINNLIYFCNFCNFQCKKNEIVNHLRSHKHQLNCLKNLSEDSYYKLLYIPKVHRRKFIFNILNHIQCEEGIGKVTVEKEYLTKGNFYDTERNTLQDQDILGSNPGHSRGTHYEDSTAMDISKSQYFCRACECNLNEAKIWKSHTEGRYLDSVEKQPRSRIHQTRAIPMPNENAFLVYRLDDATGPVVGLDYIREIQHKKDSKESYHCFLCRQCITCIHIMEHLTTQRHRMNYLEEINHDSLDYVRDLDFNINKSYYILEEICKRILNNIGPGKPEVYVVKNSED